MPNPLPARATTTPIGSIAYIWRLIGRRKCAMEKFNATNNPIEEAEHFARANVILTEIRRLLQTGSVVAPFVVRPNVPRIRFVDPGSSTPPQEK